MTLSIDQFEKKLLRHSFANEKKKHFNVFLSRSGGKTINSDSSGNDNQQIFAQIDVVRYYFSSLLGTNFISTFRQLSKTKRDRQKRFSSFSPSKRTFSRWVENQLRLKHDSSTSNRRWRYRTEPNIGRERKKKDFFLLLLDNEPFSEGFLLMMSARKRSLSTEEEFDSPEKISEEPRTPADSPNSKKRRHSSSHSDPDQFTQLLDDENGPANGKRTSRRSTSHRFRSGCSTDQSETDEDEIEAEGNEKESLLSVPFDNGKDDGKALRASRRTRSILFSSSSIRISLRRNGSLSHSFVSGASFFRHSQRTDVHSDLRLANFRSTNDLNATFRKQIQRFHRTETESSVEQLVDLRQSRNHLVASERSEKERDEK